MIDRKEFIDTLKKVTPGLEVRQGTAEQMTHFDFTGKIVQTFNEEIYVQTPLETTFKGSVKGAMLIQVLEKITDENIALARKKNELVIRARNTKAGFAVFTENELADKFEMINQIISKLKWKRLPPDFMTALKMCYFIASNQETEEGHACFQVGRDHICTIDREGIRMGLYEFEKPFTKNPFFFRASVFKSIANFAPVGFSLTENYVFFKTTDKVVFAVLRRFFEPIDRREIFEQFKNVIIRLPDSIKDDIVIADSVLTDEEKAEREIEMTAGENKLVYKAMTQTGWVERTAKIKYAKAAKKFSLNPVLLAEALSKSDFENKLWMGKTGVMIKSGNFKYAVGYVE